MVSSCSQDESACWDILKLNVKNAEAWFCRAERDHYIVLIGGTNKRTLNLIVSFPLQVKKILTKEMNQSKVFRKHALYTVSLQRAKMNELLQQVS